MTEEGRRLDAASAGVPWKKGPYLSERQWGTVREDYSPDGQAWDYFSHEQSRSRACHWGEDGLGGICDDKQRLCFSVALWNGRDPILEERPFGLTNSEGNQGEDVKEYYFYLDSTPTHSYLKFLYKYPQEAFPYRQIAETSRGRDRNEWEYELLDTGVFDKDRYFDVFVEYAKAAPEDLLIRITAFNRGPEAAPLHADLDAVLLGAVEIGYRHGLRTRPDEHLLSHATSWEGALLGLLALLIGFTFAMAVTRFDSRRDLILDEANAIESVALRARYRQRRRRRSGSD